MARQRATVAEFCVTIGYSAGEAKDRAALTRLLKEEDVVITPLRLPPWRRFEEVLPRSESPRGASCSDCMNPLLHDGAAIAIGGDTLQEQ